MWITPPLINVVRRALCTAATGIRMLIVMNIKIFMIFISDTPISKIMMNVKIVKVMRLTLITMW